MTYWDRNPNFVPVAYAWWMTMGFATLDVIMNTIFALVTTWVEADMKNQEQSNPGGMLDKIPFVPELPADEEQPAKASGSGSETSASRLSVAGPYVDGPLYYCDACSSVLFPLGIMRSRTCE
jgi:hypothetical protein